MFNATFCPPDLTNFLGLDALGLVARGLHLQPGRAVIECVPSRDDDWCGACGVQALRHGVVDRWLAHIPLGGRPTMLRVHMARYRRRECGHLWRHDLASATQAKAKLTHAAVQWRLEALVVERMSISHIARRLGVAWDTANTAILEASQRLLIEQPGRLDRVAVIGVDEHLWRHTGTLPRYVTVIIDLTPLRDKTGAARLLEMIPGRSKAMFKKWLNQQPLALRHGVEVIAMDGFMGFKTAAAETIPDAIAVMDPFHVVQLAGQALDECRRRIQQELHGHRGKKYDPLYSARRLLRTGCDLLAPPGNWSASTPCSIPTTTPLWKSPRASTST